MRTLAIDCATEACSVALFEDGALIAGTFEILGRGHAERLVPMIAALPGKGRAARIVVAAGPGSFTGVRVGLAAARALAFAWDAELVGYPTLALVAAMARYACGAQTPAPALAVAMTGGHGEWFVARFAADGTQSGADAAQTPDSAAHDVTEPVVAGSQAAALVELRGFGQALALLPDARCVNLLDPALLTPNPAPRYGRGPDARLPAGQPPA